MKTTDHLKTLIDELAVYERELKERVQQKEDELRQLLQRFAPAVAALSSASSPQPQSSSSQWQLRIDRADGAKREEASVGMSPSPCITAEKRHIHAPVASKGPCGKDGAQGAEAKWQREASALVDIDEISSISGASTVSAESMDILAKAQQLLAANDTKRGRRGRRVRFASRSPHSGSGAKASHNDSGSVKSAKETRERKPRGTSLPQSQATASLLLRHAGDTNNKPIETPYLRKSKALEALVAMENEKHTDSLNRDHGDDDDRPCYLRRKRRQRQVEEEEEEKSGERHPHQQYTTSSMSSCVPLKAENASSVVELPVVTSEPDQGLTNSLRRRRSENNYIQQQSHFLPPKNPRGSTSRSTSAARTHPPVNDAQVEGRGAGIILACGPTVFFD